MKEAIAMIENCYFVEAIFLRDELMITKMLLFYWSQLAHQNSNTDDNYHGQKVSTEKSKKQRWKEGREDEYACG